MDGMCSLKILKTDFPKIKIVVFSNYGQPKLIKEIKSPGAGDYLLKTALLWSSWKPYG
jgi:DNA-binding NarL/FixJ family response regulator